MRKIASAVAIGLPKHKPSLTLSSLLLATGWGLCQAGLEQVEE